MTWLKLDDVFARHRKVRRLSDGAFRTLVEAMLLCAGDESDGVLTPTDLDDLPTKRTTRTRERHINELLNAGVWELTLDGWVVHDFLDYNPSHTQLVQARAAAATRQARRRTTKDKPPDPPDHGVTHASSHTGSHTTPARVARPDPTRPDPRTTPSPHLHVVDRDQDQIVTSVTRAAATLGLGADT